MRIAIAAVCLALSSWGCAKISCATNERFDPRGRDAHIAGDWTVEGQTGSDETCGLTTADGGMPADIHIAQIEVLIWNEDQEEPWVNDRLRVDCASGAPLSTQTTSSGDAPNSPFNPLLGAGTYFYQWVAVATNGDVVDCKPLTQVVIPEVFDGGAGGGGGIDGGVGVVISLEPADFQLNAQCEQCPCS